MWIFHIGPTNCWQYVLGKTYENYFVSTVFSVVNTVKPVVIAFYSNNKFI